MFSSNLFDHLSYSKLPKIRMQGRRDQELRFGFFTIQFIDWLRRDTLRGMDAFSPGGRSVAEVYRGVKLNEKTQ
jgi:hypothetical protein